LKFALFNEFSKSSKISNPAQFWPEPDISWIYIKGFRPEPEPNSGTALVKALNNTHKSKK